MVWLAFPLGSKQCILNNNWGAWNIATGVWHQKSTDAQDFSSVQAYEQSMLSGAVDHLYPWVFSMLYARQPKRFEPNIGIQRH